MERNVYQTSQGGRIYCPLEASARLIRQATPLFAQQLSHKYSQMNVNAVCEDLRANHGRQIAASYVQNT
ncbi:ISKra4 family transposase, partial [Rhabdochromatium marinum]|nr:ISKra4 family transposase [Rhabdochromatium marinum]